MNYVVRPPIFAREVKLNFSFVAKNDFYFFPERSSHNKSVTVYTGMAN